MYRNTVEGEPKLESQKYTGHIKLEPEQAPEGTKNLVMVITDITDEDGILQYSHVTYEPGNGTRYEIVVVHVYERLEFGALGAVSDGFLIVNGLNQVAYLFANMPGEYLTESYVGEHLKLRGPDARYMTAMIAFMTERKAAFGA